MGAEPGHGHEAMERTPAPMDARGHRIDLSPLRTLLVRIEERYQPEQVWLFGSRARGDAEPGSDWDLLVVVPDSTADRCKRSILCERRPCVPFRR
jgi:predicted nucleotidyltransferase